MRSLSAAGAALLLSTAISQAAVVDLTYTVEAEITSIRATNNSSEPFEFFREVGDVEFYSFRARGDISDNSGFVNVSGNGAAGFGGSGSGSVVSLENGSGSFSYGNADESYSFGLRADGTGSLVATIATAPEISSFFIFETATYDVLSWSVEGLPEIAPVPLPASLPLLAVGLGAIGLFRRKT